MRAVQPRKMMTSGATCTDMEWPPCVALDSEQMQTSCCHRAHLDEPILATNLLLHLVAGCARRSKDLCASLTVGVCSHPPLCCYAPQNALMYKVRFKSTLTPLVVRT
jgi:hypothetical protein